ncbi:F-BAR domain only protein 2 isoform X3 [Photinus pyralis]|uniref:F-BAR domain only protein 2 isoform X3 n=1 Tax=Photinus pyralis TaxID=7054 RepID=UPI001266FA29|nr:F-BAR domain only protein 2 isoform X3 [Photinus pyralis]
MTVDFNDYFWGEKNNGFDVLYHNMKYGLVSSKELADFFRERSSTEENNSKAFAKLAKQAGSCCMHGTFSPLWQVLKSSAERLSTLHSQMVQKVSDLVKEINKYADDLHKKHKTVKEDESGTLEAVQIIQSTTTMVQKAKDAYTQKGLEVEKLKKENNSPKEIEKAEAKLKKAQEDYRSYVEKYNSVKEDFERKMSVTCRHFQELEVTHLTQMKEFLNSYAQVVQWTHDQTGQVHTEFKRQCLEFTVDRLLEQFVLSKYTGLEKPGLVDVEEPLTSPVQETEPNKPCKREGFLRSRRDKAKQKKAKKKKDASDNSSNKEEKSDLEEKEETGKNQTLPEIEKDQPQLDEDGYVIRQNTVPAWTNDKSSFYSSSDSDSDDERERKIHVEIKPLNNGTAPMSASVDELRATVENLYLSPLNNSGGRRGSSNDGSDTIMKRSQSVSQQLGKPSSDLLGLNLFQSPVASNASTPTSSHPYAPLQSPSQPTLNSPTLSSSSKYAGAFARSVLTVCNTRILDLGDLFSEVGEIQSPAVSTTKTVRQTPTPTSGYMSIPRPPSRRSDGVSRGHISPATISRADSVGSLEFRTACIPVGVSRGPSPLTIGMADTIPLAVAFHEIVHSFFRGTDETKCQVKMSGEMMLSFPAGIVAVLANNPNPAKLAFRVRNTQRLNSILPNNKLVSIDNTQSATDNLVLEFSMSALSALLKRQSEQNPSASYFNVEILKYQIKPKPGANSCPFQLVAYWKCETTHTDLKIDYKYNSHAMNSPSPLLNVNVIVPIDGSIKNMQSKPSAQLLAENNRVMWKFTELSQHSENHGVGSLLARLELESGPTTTSTISTQFNCEGTTLSGIDFQLVGSGYRLSLVKRRFISGKYICDGDPKYSSGTPTPPASTFSGDC